MPGLKISLYIYNSNKPGTKPAIPRVDNAPHGVETQTPLAAKDVGRQHFHPLTDSVNQDNALTDSLDSKKQGTRSKNTRFLKDA